MAKDDDVESLAATWVVRSAEGPLTSAQEDELDAWLQADSRHLGAFVRAEAMWADVDRVAAIDAGSRAGHATAASPETQDIPHRSYWWQALAASVLLVLLAGGIVYDRLAGRVATERGEVRQLSLDDGSRIIVNGDTVLQVRYGDDRRDIILRKGEAMFDVAHDESRPFIVRAADVAVRAVGTEFVVGVEDEEIAVTVAQGVVEVTDKTARGTEQRMLTRDEQIVSTPRGIRKTRLDTDEVERQLAWREGLLIFDGQTLASAAAKVNRYSARQVVIDDPTLARAEFVGVFHVGDAHSFADAVANAFNGEVVERQGNLHLRRRSNSPSH